MPMRNQQLRLRVWEAADVVEATSASGAVVTYRLPALSGLQPQALCVRPASG